MIKVGYYQFCPRFGAVKQNAKMVFNALENVQSEIIVLPELPFTGYYFKDRDELKSLAEEISHSEIIEQLVEICKKHNFYIITGFAEKSADRYYNSAVLLGPKGNVHTYRKLHLFNEEKNWFDPGDVPLRIHNIQGINVGLMICFDWIFPEVMRVLALDGADLICHPANLVLDHCQSAMVTRCLENNVFAITANRYGIEKRPHGEIKFTGKSQIVAPKGNLLNRAKSQQTQFCSITIDPALALNKYITPLNDLLLDRRSEYYLNICNRK